MIILALDFEATGLHLEGDRAIEVGAILYSTGQRRTLESHGFLVKQSDKAIDANITKITGIHQSATEHFGYVPGDSLDMLCEMAVRAEAFIGHNVMRFDKPLFENWMRQQGGGGERLPQLWIDTMTDLPGVEGRKLTHQAADLGILNFYPHAAITDCLTVLAMLERFNFDQVVERAKSPLIVIRGEHERSDNNLAKQRKFGWKPRWEMWLKVIKHCDLEAEVAAAPFNISLAPKDILVSQVWEE